MSPVHVIVGEDQRALEMWGAAFTGAVDIYSFSRNADAFERLMAAQAPVDLIVLTPAQQGPFNLTADQFIARVLEGPLASSAMLANLHVIVVGAPVARQHPRVMAVSTLDAAIRLVKFGEVEQAPMPTAPAERPRSAAADLDAMFAGSIISRIWDAPPPADAQQPGAAVVQGGGPRARTAEPAPVPAIDGAGTHRALFAQERASGFVTSGVQGGGSPAAPMAAPSPEPAQRLQPARPYQLSSSAGYRGPLVRGGGVHGASHHVAAQQHAERPVPPALASQVHSMVYAGMQVGNPADPLLTFSNGGQTPAAPAASAPVAAPMPVQPQPQPQPIRTLPLEPPTGAYPGSAPAAAPASAPSDPFLQRAEQAGASVSFG